MFLKDRSEAQNKNEVASDEYFAANDLHGFTTFF